MRRIGIDCRFASGNAGLGTYTREIVHALLRRDDGVCYTLFVQTDNEPWLRLLPKNDGTRLVEAPFRHYSYAEQLWFGAVIKESRCDLFYAPHFNVPLRCPVPFVCTVHDLILHRYPNEAGFLKRVAYRCLLHHSLAHARAIVAVSEHTKQDIVQHYPRCAEKIVVVNPGVHSAFVRESEAEIDAARKRYDLSKSFLLYVGNCKQHKNVPMLIDAFKKAGLDGIDLVLVSTGKECESLVLPEGVRRIRDVQSNDVPALYSAALGLVTATLDEGFGLPMVEAMACGTPVLATTCGAIPEVCGEHALLVQPTIEALCEGMRTIVSDQVWHSPEHREAAMTWVRKYNWDDSAFRLAGTLALL